jgi:Cys-tRNA(Pro)/Cys-tRNA(Cys) deacylase
MSRATRATWLLDGAGIAYRLHAYDFDAEAAVGKGVHAAQSLGVPPARVLKTLMAWVDDRAVCAVIPSDHQLQLKQLAAACGGKSARMMEVPEAERRSGYKVGGISPFAQQRPLPVWIEARTLVAESIYINAGQRGLLLELAPADAVKILQARAAKLCE